MNSDTEDFAALNRKRVATYFEGGFRPKDEARHLGVEAEHFVVRDNGASVSYSGDEGDFGVRDVLEYLSGFYPDRFYNLKGELIALANETASITLEPAAQLEISIAPYTEIADIARAYTAFRDAVDPYLSLRGAHLVSHGYHPTMRAQDMPLIPKERYRLMDAHFARIGSHGERMMRASASTQVSIDFTDEADAVRKFRVASAIGPVLAAITDNTPLFEAGRNDAPIARLNLWRHVDDARCRVVPGTFDEGFGFQAYADWMLNASPIFVDRPAADDPDGPAIRATGDLPTRIAYADAPMSRGDIEHLISMFWPDVRFKRFVEVRQADCLPAADIFGYTALIKGLFYSEDSLAALEKALGVEDDVWPLTEGAVDETIRAIREKGFDANVYGRSLEDWEKLLFSAARAALAPEEASYLDSLERFAEDKPWW